MQLLDQFQSFAAIFYQANAGLSATALAEADWNNPMLNAEILTQKNRKPTFARKKFAGILRIFSGRQRVFMRR
jgi:hypothetical protein